MRSLEDFQAVQELVALGHSDSEIRRLTDIPRSTIRDWRAGLGATSNRDRRDCGHNCSGDHDYAMLPSIEYCYVLGMYLGDGYINRTHRGVWRLRITCDERYPEIVSECRSALTAIMPNNRAGAWSPSSSRCVIIYMYSRHWPCYLPHHGVGRKHERRIALHPWQEAHVANAPHSFVRGLIHSDGCRTIANDRGNPSVRYHFSNRSEDIKRLFCSTLDDLGIPWTRPSNRDIAIYRKEATARLDEFVGPKK